MMGAKKQQRSGDRAGSKSEARNPKLETISKVQNPKHQTPPVWVI
jgi:hypothetical protein